MLRNIQVIMLFIACLLLALPLMVLAKAFGQQHRVGPWLVRGKYCILRLLKEWK